MSFKYRVAFIGHVGEGYGDFLNRLYYQLNENDVGFEAVFFGQHERSFIKDEKYLFDYYDVEYLPNPDELIASPEVLVGILQSDFYIIWNGYHNVYAKIRSYLDEIKAPYLLSEYTSIEGLYHFDRGLHGERSRTDFTNKKNSFSLEKLSKYIGARYGSNDKDTDETVKKIKELKKDKKLLLYLGIWDEAAGLNPYTSKETKNNLFPYFSSTYEALEALVESVDKDTVILIKLHPNDNTTDIEKINNLIKMNSNLMLINKDISSEELIKTSDLTATMTSTLSLYSAYHKVPLLLMANSYLADSEYTYQLKDKRELKELIYSALNGENWDIKLNEREKFFQDFVCNSNVYTINEELVSMGVKTASGLVSIIVQKKREFFGLSWEDKRKIFKLISQEKQVITSKIKEIEQRDLLLEDRSKEIKQRDLLLEDRSKEIKQRDLLLEDRSKEIKQNLKYIEESEETIKELSCELDTIYSSKAWKMIERYRSMKIKIIDYSK